MSYWVSLNANDKPVQVENFAEGGTFVLGGSTEADLNITYNYGRLFRSAMSKDEGIRWLHDKPAFDTISVLEKAVEALGILRDEDYWGSTPGNAGHALNILLTWARQYPSAVWRVN